MLTSYFSLSYGFCCCNWQIRVTLTALPGIQKDTINCVGRPSQSAHPVWYQKGGMLFLLQKESSNYLYQLCIYARVLLRHDETYKEGGFFFQLSSPSGKVAKSGEYLIQLGNFLRTLKERDMAGRWTVTF